MRKIILCLNCSIIFQFAAFSQAPDTLYCDYADRDTAEAKQLPWFGNNDYLENFLDSIGYPAGGTGARIVGRDRVWYHIPIKFWVYRNNAGIGGPTIEELRDYIDHLNNFYNVENDTRIGFYMKCNIGYIDDNDHLEVGDAEAWNLIQNHKEKGAINIHITDDLKGPVGVHYRARFFGVDGIFLNRETYTNNDFIGTIAHEVGHYLELDHTHQYEGWDICLREGIDRNRTWPINPTTCLSGWTPIPFSRVCETTGDFLSDTPADHNLNTNNSCSYILTGLNDLWGDSYATPPAGSSSPDPGNLMSYNGDRSCRTGFSRLQIGVLLYSIVKGKSKNNRAAWGDDKGIYDEYEYDDNPEVARPITIGEIQDRNFHQQILTEDFGGDPIWSQCDVDWVRFTAPCNSTLEIFTEILPWYTGTKAANTRLTLFNASLTQLAQNDDISGSNKFSSITYSFVSGQQYFIRVENMSPGTTTRYYRLVLGRFEVTGDQSFCTSGNYTVPNLPTGSTVTWSATPFGAVGFSCNPCSTVALTKNYDAAVNLTATITNICGSVGPVITTKNNIAVGNPPLMEPTGADTVWPSGHYTYNMFLPLGYPPATYTWTVPSGWTIVSGQSTNSIYVYTGTTGGAVEVEVTICGVARPVYKWVEVGSGPWWPDGGGGEVYMRQTAKLSPNPAENLVTISMNSTSKTLKAGKEAGVFFTDVIIYDMTGAIQKRLRYGKATRQAQVNISDMRPGTYIVEITDGKNNVERQRLLIQK